MEEYQIRVLEEKKELDIKIKSLQTYLETKATYMSISEKVIQDMEDQLEIMFVYSSILKKRINRF